MLSALSAACSDGTRYDLSEVARLHSEFGVRRSGFYRRHPDDGRLKKKFAGSRREKERVRQLLHKKAKEIVDDEEKEAGDRPREAEGYPIRSHERER